MAATTVQVSRSYEIPDEDVETVIEMAGYGMVGWALRGENDSEKRTYTVTLDPTAAEEADKPLEFTLTYDQIAQTLADVAFKKPLDGLSDSAAVRDYAVDYFAELDAGEIDADLGDVVIQLAAFGELIFG
jgi:hypothetical protein